MIKDLVDGIISWPGLLAALLIFGFAPGAALRFIVLAFPSTDPRRRELMAELHAVPRIERPFWVVEQLEVALFEGLWGRIVALGRDGRRRLFSVLVGVAVAVGVVWLGTATAGSSPIEVAAVFYRLPGLLARAAGSTLLVASAAFGAAALAGLLISLALAALHTVGDLVRSRVGVARRRRPRQRRALEAVASVAPVTVLAYVPMLGVQLETTYGTCILVAGLLAFCPIIYAVANGPLQDLPGAGAIGVYPSYPRLRSADPAIAHCGRTYGRRGLPDAVAGVSHASKTAVSTAVSVTVFTEACLHGVLGLRGEGLGAVMVDAVRAADASLALAAFFLATVVSTALVLVVSACLRTGRWMAA